MMEQEQDDSIRGSLVDAFEQHDIAGTEDKSAPTTVESQTTETTDAEIIEEVKKPVEGAGADKSKAGADKSKAGAEKGADGKFKANVEEKDPNEQVPDKSKPAFSRAPGSWKPVAREKWNALPPEIQQEVLRREREISAGFNETAQARRLHQDFNTLAQAHQGIIAAEGGDSMAVTKNLYTTASNLYYGNPQQKAATVAAMIKSFNIDLPMLDGILAGQMPQQGQQNQPQQMDIQQLVTQQVQQTLRQHPAFQAPQIDEGALQSELDSFAVDPKNEFFEDVRETMADLLELSANRGIKMDLPTAYSRAILAHSDIADIVAERKLREKVSEGNKIAERAGSRRASFRRAPDAELASGKSQDQERSLRDDLMDAIDNTQ